MILILGTTASGGVKSVIQSYIDFGVYSKVGYRFVPTHAGKSKVGDLLLFFRSFFLFIYMIFLKKPTAVHAHMTYNGSFWRKYLFFKLSKLARIPFICHLHGSEFKVYVNNSTGFRFRKIKEIVLFSDRFLVLSKGWKEYVDGTFGGSCFVLPNFIDLPRNVNAEQPKLKKIIFVGALIQRKGVLDLIEAFSRLCSDYSLEICGDGPLRSEAEKLSQKLGLQSSVNFHGWLSGDSKYTLYKQSEIFVLPSYNEGLPLVVLEAIASKCVVVSTNVGAIAEVVENGRTGFIFSPGDIDGLVEHLKYILNHPHEIPDIIEDAYELYVQKYCSKAVLPVLKNVYTSLAIDV